MSEGIVLGFESACALWRRVGERVALRNQPDERVSPLLIRLLFDKGTGVDLSDMPQRCRVTRIPANVDAPKLRIFQGELGEGEAVLHLCVSRRTGRRFVSGAICHLMSGSYPAGSFSRLEDGVLVASPELTFMQMARFLDEDLLVAYGYELCGYFARCHDEPGFCNCPPLTSVSRISEYLGRLEQLREERGEGMPWGLAKARRALSHVRDGAASPEEAVVAMVLTLPKRRGGYGIPRACLNAVVRLGAEAAELFGIDSFVCDLSWNNGSTVLEYQGSQHKLRSRRSYDLRKGNVLVADGRSVIEMDRRMLARREFMDEVAKSVSMALGIRWRSPSPRAATKQLALRNKLIQHLDAR